MLCCDWWGLDVRQAKRLWEALAWSRWSRPKAWRFRVQCLDGFLSDADHFVHAECEPSKIMQILEDLIHEKRLGRQDGRRMEDVILRMVDRHGRWRDDVSSAEARAQIQEERSRSAPLQVHQSQESHAGQNANVRGL